jgi:hypothetical protein
MKLLSDGGWDKKTPAQAGVVDTTTGGLGLDYPDARLCLGKIRRSPDADIKRAKARECLIEFLESRSAPILRAIWFDAIDQIEERSKIASSCILFNGSKKRAAPIVGKYEISIVHGFTQDVQSASLESRVFRSGTGVDLEYQGGVDALIDSTRSADYFG